MEPAKKMLRQPHPQIIPQIPTAKPKKMQNFPQAEEAQGAKGKRMARFCQKVEPQNIEIFRWRNSGSWVASGELIFGYGKVLSA